MFSRVIFDRFISGSVVLGVVLFIWLAIYPASESLAIHCQDYWTPEYKCAMGCGPCGESNTNQQSGPSAAQIAAQQAAAARQEREAAEQQQREADATEQNEKGLDAWKNKDWAAAADYFQKAVQDAPDNQTFQDNLDRAKQRLKEEQDKKIATNNIQHSIQDLTQKLRAAPSSSGLDFMSAKTAKPALEFGDPNIVEPVLIKASVQSISKVQAEIQGVQEALKRLKRSTSLDAEERKEWEKRSDNALRDSYALGADAAVNVLTACTERQIKAQKKELWRANDMLAGETDPNRREQLHVAFRVLNDRKVELEQIKERLEKAHDAVEILNTTQDMAYSKEEEESKNQIEAVWVACDKLNILPKGASQAKAIVDASYDITVQAFSLQRINALNANSEQYLKTVDVLSKRMKTLVELKKAQAQTN